METSFYELSKILTGWENIQPRLAKLYGDQLARDLGPQIGPLLSTFEHIPRTDDQDMEEAVRNVIWSDNSMQAMCQAIIQLWYTARLDTTALQPRLPIVKWIAPLEGYYEALLWKTIEAHPPALSGGYFGYWRYAPEN